MNTLAIALMIVIALLLAGVIILLIQGRPKADMTAQRLELLERRLAESMYDLRTLGKPGGERQAERTD